MSTARSAGRRRAGLCVASRLVAVAEVLGQVFGEVADAPAGIAGSGEDALGVEPGTEPGDVPWLVLVADGVERLVPGREDLACSRVDVVAGVLTGPGETPPCIDSNTPSLAIILSFS